MSKNERTVIVAIRIPVIYRHSGESVLVGHRVRPQRGLWQAAIQSIAAGNRVRSGSYWISLTRMQVWKHLDKNESKVSSQVEIFVILKSDIQEEVRQLLFMINSSLNSVVQR